MLSSRTSSAILASIGTKSSATMPKIKRARYIDRGELMELLAAVVSEKSLTHADIAGTLGVSRPAVSQALNDPNSRNDSLRVRILREIGGILVSEEKFWKVGGEADG